MTNLVNYLNDYRASVLMPKRDVEIDPFGGLESLVGEISEAAVTIRDYVNVLRLARNSRDMGGMLDTSRELHRRVEQLRIMAETMLRVTATHKARGVK